MVFTNMDFSKVYVRAFALLLTLLLCPMTLVHAEEFDSASEIAIVNGNLVADNQYPALTAIRSGRFASIIINGLQASARYFGHGVHGSFEGDVVNCGFATTVCQGVTGQICSISIAAPSLSSGLSPAKQLENCSLGGGVAAVFRSNEAMTRTDMFDGNPVIPAVYVADFLSYQLLVNALDQPRVTVKVEPRVINSILCGASYIGNQWLVTAAHCLLEETPDGMRQKLPWEIVASVGAYNLSQISLPVQTVSEIHFNSYQLQGIGSRFDIALLKLTDDAQTINNTAVKIASADTVRRQSLQSSEALVLGWGSTQVREPLEDNRYSTTSMVPRSALLTLTPINQCAQQWNDFLRANNLPDYIVSVEENQLCADEPASQRDTCQGDSGGPLLLEVDGELQLAGITSFGLGCGSLNSPPGVYTRVSAYMDWISETTGINILTDDAPIVTVASGDQPKPVLPAGNILVTGVGASGFSGAGSVDLSLLLLLFMYAPRYCKRCIRL